MARKSTTSQDRTGEGGELHQAPTKGQVMTTAQGISMSDDQNSLKAGERGPTLLEDFAMREKIFHFDHERIPERVVHARGYGAHGYLECLDPVTDLTRAAPFQRKGKRTEAFVRFSTVAGNLGSFDLAATCAASRSSSTPTRATGTWWAATSRCSSSRTP